MWWCIIVPVMTKTEFEALLRPVLDTIRDRQLDTGLEQTLGEKFPAGGAYCRSVLSACQEGDAGGWICDREAGGIRYGRVIKPGPTTHGFSVDVVQMSEIAGPHHVHPNGEIDLTLPTEGEPTFDGHSAGWVVYAPGSAHQPTVKGGCAYVVYFLPGGAINFTNL
jgi:hypothetical protein